MLTSIRPVGVRPFPCRTAGTWSCTHCGLSARVDRSWTVEVEAIHGRRFSIVVCEDCAGGVELVEV